MLLSAHAFHAVVPPGYKTQNDTMMKCAEGEFRSKCKWLSGMCQSDLHQLQHKPCSGFGTHIPVQMHTTSLQHCVVCSKSSCSRAPYPSTPAILESAPSHHRKVLQVLSYVPQQGLTQCYAPAGALWSDERGWDCDLCGDGISAMPTDADEHPLRNGTVAASTSSCCEYHSC
jgi:hypothetical protein